VIESGFEPVDFLFLMLLHSLLVLVQPINPVLVSFLSSSSLCCFECDDFKKRFVEKDLVTLIVIRLLHIWIDDVS
jgi:hypothetical protein